MSVETLAPAKLNAKQRREQVKAAKAALKAEQAAVKEPETKPEPKQEAKTVVMVKENLSTADILKNKVSAVKTAKALNSRMTVDIRFSRFCENPSKYIPAKFRTVEDAKEFIKDWRDAIKTTGEIEPQAKRTLVRQLINADIQSEVNAIRVKLTTQRGIPFELSEEQQAQFAEALAVYENCLRTVIGPVADAFVKSL